MPATENLTVKANPDGTVTLSFDPSVRLYDTEDKSTGEAKSTMVTKGRITVATTDDKGNPREIVVIVNGFIPLGDKRMSTRRAASIGAPVGKNNPRGPVRRIQ